MAFQLVYYPDPILKRRCPPLNAIDDDVRERVKEMFAILYREKGVGLAAPQVGWSARVFIANTTGEPNPEAERVYINPRISAAEGELREEEGCLSLPNIRGMVTRSDWVKISAQALDGEVFEEECSELEARVIQHEFDHLDGILFISRLSSADRLLVNRELKNLESRYADRTSKSR